MLLKRKKTISAPPDARKKTLKRVKTVNTIPQKTNTVTDDFNTDLLPVFIIHNTNNLNDNRYLVIIKQSMGCITAKDTLQDCLDVITFLTRTHGKSMDGLRDYLTMTPTDYPLKPQPTVYEARKRVLLSGVCKEFDEQIYDAIRVGENCA